MKFIHVLPIITLSMSSLAIADVSPALERDFMQTFAQCDSSMFKFIKQHKQELSEYAPIIEKGNFAYFESDENGFVSFAQPLIINDIELTGYFQYQAGLEEMSFGEDDYETTSLKDLQRQSYYFWGFTTNEPNEKRTARKLSQFNFTNYHNLRHISHWLIADVRKSQQWQYKNLQWGHFPKPYSVERIFYIDGSDKPVSLNCSMQGEISPKLLKSIRPDL